MAKILKTYDEWKAEGYGVIKGEKSKVKKDGKCYFDETQVLNINEYYNNLMKKENNRMINDLIGK